MKRDPRSAQARVSSILRGVSGSSVHARGLSGLFGEGGRVSRARPKLSVSALEASSFHDDVPVAVYDGLITRSARRNSRRCFVITNCAGASSELDELHHYDTYVPLVAEIETHISFDEAIERSWLACAPLGQEYVARAGRGFARTLVRSLRNEGKTQRRILLRQLRRAALHPDELQGGRVSPTSTRSPTKPGTRCTPGSRKTRSLSGLRLPDFPRRSRQHVQRGAAHPSSCSKKPATRKCAPTSSTARSTTSAARSSGRRCSPSSRKSFTPWRKRGEALTLDVFKAEYRKLLEAYFGEAIVPSIRSSIWNACASRISTARFTSTNTPPEFPPRWRFPNAFWRRNRRG